MALRKLSLFKSLQENALNWRKNGYAGTDFPLIGELLRWQFEDAATGGGENGGPVLKYLREPQFQALEIYWYVRVVKKTPHIMELYKDLFPDKADFVEALGLQLSEDTLRYIPSLDTTIEKEIKDRERARENRLEAAYEAATLEYPSYILALAMGAGKTVLIGAIVATEFAMSLRHPEGNFMKNALVFAPGTTIIESLRELSGMPFEKILPPDLNRDFAANLKLEYPRAGAKDIQAQRGSGYNMIVVNTEKISLRARRRSNHSELDFERAQLEANRRLQTIASLPQLGVFSDEAHHTYGNTLDKLKRVRETINYIHEQTSLVAVVNTTGTPYYKRQTLKEVIVWYGLKDGIRDNILKDLNRGLYQYNLKRESEPGVFNDIVKNFFDAYGEVALPDGARAKIAFYFKTQEHLDQSRAHIETAMAEIGQSPAQILINTQRSSKEEIDDFKRLNDPDNQKRVILLIGKGVEGWNCPSLFACALIKEQTSNNYILQAATRCLRQVPGNLHSARVFVDYDNSKILDRELMNNFGAALDYLSGTAGQKKTVTLRIVKTELPKLEFTRAIKRVVRSPKPRREVELRKPKSQQPPVALRAILTLNLSGTGEMLTPTGEMETLPASKPAMDCYAISSQIAARYHLPALPLLKQLRGLYPKGKVPTGHLYGLFKQVEEQQSHYEEYEEQITEAMALIRIQDRNGKDVFEKDEAGCYIHRLRLLKRTHERMEEGGLFVKKEDQEDKHELSFHYTPYNFDSKPERSFFRQILSNLNATPDEVEAFLFTGGLTDPNKTDFHFEYLGEDQRYHRYFPDFVIVKKTGEFYIIEIKAENERGDATVEAKKKAVERLREIQPDKFKYSVMYTADPAIELAKIRPVTDWLTS